MDSQSDNCKLQFCSSLQWFVWKRTDFKKKERKKHTDKMHLTNATFLINGYSLYAYAYAYLCE